MNIINLSLYPELCQVAEQAQEVHHRMMRLGHSSYELGPYATRDIVSNLREELEEVKKDYACLAQELDGHDATECLMNLRRLKEDRAELAEWKRQQMLVESQWDEQEVGRLLGMTIGTPIRANILPCLHQLKQDAEKWREAQGRSVWSSKDGCAGDTLNY